MIIYPLPGSQHISILQISNIANHRSRSMQNSTYENEHAIFNFDIQDPFVVLILLDHNKGKVKCKTCNETYRPDQLKPITIGQGLSSPFNFNNQPKGGIFRNLFNRKKQFKTKGMFGGRGYECPKGHELISLVTWQT